MKPGVINPGRGLLDREASGTVRRRLAADLCAVAALTIFPAALVLGVVVLDPENRVATADLWYSGFLVIVFATIVVTKRALRLRTLGRDASAATRSPLEAALPHPAGAGEALWAAVAKAERAEAARRLEASDSRLREELEAYLASVHALKTPATALNLLADRAERDGADLSTADLRAEIDELCRVIDRIMGRIRLVDFEAGSIAQREVDVAEAVRASLRKHRRLFIARKVAVSVEGGCVTDTDPSWLGFILDQAFSNAGKYAAASVKVRMSLINGVASVEIADDGPGMNDYDAAAAFGPSATGSAGRMASAGEEKGPDASGYGLYLAGLAANRLGWRLSLSSGPGGAGTVFRVEMPASTKLTAP
ncbi:MAG TPA: HAMP domain-containing sensor histidine kinase [Rectinemataceae bacterium]|nr:HAMP domain-containing sensor histidine kinase [Rectinemataceae bacterium]